MNNKKQKTRRRKRSKISVGKSHRIKELEQEKILLEALYTMLDDTNQDLENSRTSLKEDIRKLVEIIHRNHKKYVDLYDQSPDMYRTINTEGVILDCNESYAKRLGYPKEEIIGKSIFNHSANIDVKNMRNSFETWRKKGAIRNKEIWLKCSDGCAFPGLLSATNLYDDNNKLIGSNSVIKDITEIYEYRKKLEESQDKIKQQLSELKKSSNAKDSFLAMVTHELKTPLVPIKSYIDMIVTEKLGPLNDMQRERLSVVRSSTESLLKLVNDLLDVQKLELGQLRLTKGVHNLAEILNQTLEKMSGEITKKDILIRKNIKNNIFCLCDPMRMEQVFTNLFVNAIKFSPNGNAKISVNLRSENGHGKVIVKDNGIGIVRDKLEKIFVKFYQIDATTTREYGGTGLGLSVCKGLIEQHGGKIWAESKGRGKGTEIHILLPRTRAR